MSGKKGSEMAGAGVDDAAVADHGDARSAVRGDHGLERVDDAATKGLHGYSKNKRRLRRKEQY